MLSHLPQLPFPRFGAEFCSPGVDPPRQNGGATVETVEEGGIVGEMATVNHLSPRTATVSALTDSVVVALTEDEFLRHVHSTPFFALQVLRITAERLRRANARV